MDAREARRQRILNSKADRLSKITNLYSSSSSIEAESNEGDQSEVLVLLFVWFFNYLLNTFLLISDNYLWQTLLLLQFKAPLARSSTQSTTQSTIPQSTPITNKSISQIVQSPSVARTPVVKDTSTVSNPSIMSSTRDTKSSTDSRSASSRQLDQLQSTKESRLSLLNSLRRFLVVLLALVLLWQISHVAFDYDQDDLPVGYLSLFAETVFEKVSTLLPISSDSLLARIKRIKGLKYQPYSESISLSIPSLDMSTVSSSNFYSTHLTLL